MVDPRVSVIIPTYNRRQLLKRAVASVIDQTYANFEIIIIDDCSADGTREEVSSIADNRIRYFRNDSCRGANYSRNVGIRASRGEIICLLDDDDEWLPTKLERQLEALDNAPSSVGMVHSGFWVITDNGATVREVSYQMRGNIHTEVLRRNLIGALTSMVKKEHIVIAGLFDETLPSCQDWDLWIRVSKLCDAEYVPEPLAKYHLHGNQISTNIDKILKGRLMILSKYGGEIKKHSDIKAEHLQQIAVLYHMLPNRVKEIEYIARSIIAHPRCFVDYLPLVFKVIFPKPQPLHNV